MNFHRFTKNLFAIWMMMFFLSTPILGPRMAHAQGLPVVDLQQFGIWLKDNVTTFIQNTMQAAIVTALINAASYAADRLAYDAAVRIATGGAAEEPLFDGTANDTYLGSLVTGIAGEAIGSLSEEISGAGGLLSNFDLCAPSSPYILAQFKLGIKGVFDRPEPKCDFNKMFGPDGTWTSFIADLEGYDNAAKNNLILTELANMYDPQKSEFGAGLQISTDIFGQTTFLPLIGVQEKIQNGGFKDVVNFITGNVETPADILATQVKSAQEKSGDVRQQATFAMLGNKELILQIGIHAASVFTNTLLSKGQERIWEGLFDFDSTLVDPFDPDSFALNTSAETAKSYRSLLSVAPLQITNYSILSEFIACPSSDIRGLYNCVVDSNFVSAVARAESGAPITIAEAIDDGLIDGSWPLISSGDVARNQDAYCYTYGFCYANLVKLRKARVISIGWELAANSSANTVESPVTLQEVIDGFHSCGSDGLPNDDHPWCNMIDPNWVLKYPDTQCRMQAYGEILLTDKADERSQTCVDMPSCIQEDENGNCISGYGYCVAEENTWQFRGESCPEYAASCLSFTDSSGESLALLKNTLDPGPCTEDTVGCQWYASTQELQDDGTFAFSAISSISDSDTDTATYASRIYFNSQAEECDEEDGGCATLIERDADLRLNTIVNPSFEVDENSDNQPDGWYEYHLSGASWPSEISSDGTYARQGDVAVSPGKGGVGLGALYQPGIELGQARTYVLSFYARQESDGDTDTITTILDLKDEDGTGVDIAGLAISGDCDDSYTNLTRSIVSTGIGIENVQPASSDYERFSCTFTVPPLPDTSARIFGDLYLLNFDGYIDSVQLEQGEDISLPVSGYSATDYDTVVAKVAPAYLGCTGSGDDPAECANYAQVCAEQDVGCTLYAPVNGDPSISGIATELDLCPSECSGYDTYRQEATRYEPDGIDAVYFIPDTANECSAEAVGCDEFTNLGTEEKQYFSFMRACVTEAQASANVSSDQEATYYTWEGSDESGYQLRTWVLLESNAGSSDYTHIGSDGVTDTAPDQAPCSNWVTDNDGITCNDTEDTDGDGYYDWDTEACNTRADIFTNANCREFYDENGNIHYRDWENSVTVNNECQAYRKTTLAGDSAAEQETICTESGGYYVADSGECRYYGYEEESTLCAESANGCRAYAGGRSRNSRLVLQDLFEEGTLNAWDAASATYATYSNESLAAEGHSMLITGPVTSFTFDNGSVCTDETGCAGSATSFGGECTVSLDGTYCGTLENELFSGKTYTISVVAKGTGTLRAGFDFNADPTSPNIDIAFNDAVPLEDGWQVLTLGPLIMDAEDYPLFGEGTSLVFIPTGTAYIDNIILREGEENITVIRDSWVTPASCDQSITGDVSPQYYLGCQEYTTQDNETAYLKSLSSLCDEDKVGCSSFFKTQESDSVTAETRNATCNNVDADGNGVADTAPSATACYYFYASGLASFDTASPYLCTIATGESSCLFSQDGFTPDWLLSSSVAVSYGPETVVTPADQDMFLVITDEVTCSSGAAGCTELGDPQWSQDRNSITGADSVYLLNLPETYDDILCAHEELFCDAFTTQDTSTYYLKNPLDQVCEYKTSVTVDGILYDGWFREGTSDFCYGTCEDSDGNEGGACGSSADCSSNETCDATNPSYVIGGTESGIWRNGDDQFGDWAGLCSATYDTCTEFQDPLAQDDGELYGTTDGTPYFYLNDTTLSSYGLSDSVKCNDQVSLKNGCAMFYDTGDTSFTANASATEISSRHADTLFGSEPYGLVDPIDCSDGGDTTITTSTGEEIDLCATRCVYDYGEMYDLTDGVTYRNKLDDERTSSNTYGRDDLYIFGGSCYDMTDCPTIRAESGANIEAVSCATQVRVDPFSRTSSFGDSFETWRSSSLGNDFAEVPRQENDVNSVLKVNRDRACAEWLACSSTTTQWDEATASFITTCSDIALCKDFDATTGSSFCSDWDFEQPEVIFDADWYASRDTSWYGNEYSGMAIPNLFPVQSLTQADVSSEGYCVSTDSDGKNGVLYGNDSTNCDVGDVCGPADAGECMSPEDALDAGAIESLEYALVLNAGSCNDEGASCSVGHCEENGAACATSSQCSSGACIVGSCYEVSTTLCQTALDCSEGQTCYGGACADIGETVEIENYDVATGVADTCVSGETFVPEADMKIGSCVNSQCLLAPSGDTYASGNTEGKICRAYPEGNSPFPTSVVDQWYEPSSPGDALSSSADLSPDALPYGTLSNFDNVVTCAYGEDCDCSYTKVTFGVGSDVRYYASDWEVDISVCSGAFDDVSDAGQVCTSNSQCNSGSCVSATDQLGVCQSGDRAGGYCTENEQCGNADDICAKTTREDVIYGLNGFCLEKDTATTILGDRDKKACLSWLPVDQLSGDTDLRAKYIAAGYFEDTFMCTDLRPFVDVGMSMHEKAAGEIACAETNGGLTSFDDSYDTWSKCDERLSCPDGFFAILGAAAYNTSGSSGYLTSACAESSGIDNDCPYVCVPENASAYDEATDTYDTAVCDPASYEWAEDPKDGANNTEVYYASINDGTAEGVYGAFDEKVAIFENCYARGVRATRTAEDDISSDLADITNWPSSDDSDPDGGTSTGYRSLYFATTARDSNDLSLDEYAGCAAVTQVASAKEGFAWTDRVYNGYTLETSNTETAYSELTTPDIFGALSKNPSIVDAAASAIMVAQCDDGGTSLQPTEASIFTVCPSGYSEHNRAAAAPTGDALEGRALINFTYDYDVLNLNTSQGSSSTWTDSSIWSVSPSSTAASETFSSITQVFASVVDSTTWLWNGEFNPGALFRGYVNEVDTDEFSGLEDSILDVRAVEGNAPTVWAVNTQSCSDDGTLCEEGTAGRITVNSQDTGNQSGVQFFNATVKFFAAADKNQLPLRRIIVDWGDDLEGGSYTGSDADDNYFKNSRGLQNGTQNSKCDLDTEWGLTDESCDPYYFTYNHIYTCSPEILRDSTAACVGETGDADGNFPCWQDQSGDGVADACVFKPRVHVRDNWGFCTGTCTTGDDGTTACFDGGSISNTGSESQDECHYASSNTNIDSYIDYTGIITVTP